METKDGSFERLDRKFLTCRGAVPGKGQDNNNLKKTRGPKLRTEGSRDDPRSGVKNSLPRFTVPTEKRAETVRGLK